MTTKMIIIKIIILIIYEISTPPQHSKSLNKEKRQVERKGQKNTADQTLCLKFTKIHRNVQISAHSKISKYTEIFMQYCKSIFYRKISPLPSFIYKSIKSHPLLFLVQLSEDRHS